MEIRIIINKTHFYLLAALTTLLFGGIAAVAFGGSSPAIMGHSAGELIVNSASVVDNSIGAADIDSTSLASECTSITGGASLCDGSDQDTDTRCDTTSCNTIDVTGIQRSSAGFIDIQDEIRLPQGTLNINGNFIDFANKDITDARILSGSNSISTTTGTISTGGNVVSRSTGCPSFNYLTTDPVVVGGCIGLVDTGLRVD